MNTQEQRIKLWCNLLLKWGDAEIADSHLKEFDKRFPIWKELTGEELIRGEQQKENVVFKYAESKVVIDPSKVIKSSPRMVSDGVTIGTTPYFPNPHGISANKTETPVTDKPYDFTCPNSGESFYLGDRCYVVFVEILDTLGSKRHIDNETILGIRNDLAHFHTSENAIAWSKAKHGKQEIQEELYYCFGVRGEIFQYTYGLPVVYAKDSGLIKDNFHAYYPVDYVNEMIKQGKRYSDFDTSKMLKI